MEQGIGKIFVISGPSGVGKDTIMRVIRERMSFYTSISVTTRQPRPGEKAGIDYHFVNEKEFQQMNSNGKFLEFAHVHKWWFGTLKEPVENALREGQNILMVLDPLGAVVIKERLPEMVLIYVQYESGRIRERIRMRLKHDAARGQVGENEVVLRARTARKEETLKSFFKYVVTNREGKLDDTVEEISNIILAELAEHR